MAFKEIAATIIRGYYYALVEGPDGIRLEMNFVPRAGLLAAEMSFNPPRVISETAVVRARHRVNGE